MWVRLAKLCQQSQNTQVVITHFIDHLRKDCVSLFSNPQGMDKCVMLAKMLRGYDRCDLGASPQRSLGDIGCRLNTTRTKGGKSNLSSD